MQVFIVITRFDYEGEDVKAVFSTKKKADKYMSGLELLPHQRVALEVWYVDSWDVDSEVSEKHTEPLDKKAERREERPTREYDRNETLRKLVE